VLDNAGPLVVDLPHWAGVQRIFDLIVHFRHTLSPVKPIRLKVYNRSLLRRRRGIV
jgi:hypothetical protein